MSFFSHATTTTTTNICDNLKHDLTLALLVGPMVLGRSSSEEENNGVKTDAGLIYYSESGRDSGYISLLFLHLLILLSF